MKNFLNPERHQNCFIGSKVTVILLKGWILPIGGVASGGSAPAACAAGFFYPPPSFLWSAIGKWLNSCMLEWEEKKYIKPTGTRIFLLTLPYPALFFEVPVHVANPMIGPYYGWKGLLYCSIFKGRAGWRAAIAQVWKYPTNHMAIGLPIKYLNSQITIAQYENI